MEGPGSRRKKLFNSFSSQNITKFGIKMARNFSVVDTIISATKTPGQSQSLTFVTYKQVIKNMKIFTLTRTFRMTDKQEAYLFFCVWQGHVVNPVPFVGEALRPPTKNSDNSLTMQVSSSYLLTFLKFKRVSGVIQIVYTICQHATCHAHKEKPRTEEPSF